VKDCALKPFKDGPRWSRTKGTTVYGGSSTVIYWLNQRPALSPSSNFTTRLLRAKRTLQKTVFVFDDINPSASRNEQGLVLGLRLKTWTQSEFCTWQNSIKGQRPQVYNSVPAQDTAKHRAVWLTSVARRRCSNETNTRNPLKFAGVPKAHQSISAVNGPTFTILRGHVEEILLFNNFSHCQCVP